MGVKVKVKVKDRKGKGKAARIKARIKEKGYVGDEAMREKARADSLQKQLDSVKLEVKLKWEEKK